MIRRRSAAAAVAAAVAAAAESYKKEGEDPSVPHNEKALVGEGEVRRVATAPMDDKGWIQYNTQPRSRPVLLLSLIDMTVKLT
jgi:hypothetical protein